jgi:hypothetical protein
MCSWNGYRHIDGPSPDHSQGEHSGPLRRSLPQIDHKTGALSVGRKAITRHHPLPPRHAAKKDLPKACSRKDPCSRSTVTSGPPAVRYAPSVLATLRGDLTSRQFNVILDFSFDRLDSALHVGKLF